MTSIRWRTSMLVAMSMASLLIVGGIVLVVMLRAAMTVQFDDALRARAAALQSLTRFDGTKVEMDVSTEAMPGYAQNAGADFFVAWVREGQVWRVLERAGSLGEIRWPPEALRDGPLGIRDLVLPGGNAGRSLLVEFAASRERDEESDGRTPLVGNAAKTAVVSDPAQAPLIRILVATPRSTLDHTLAMVGWCIFTVGGALSLASIAAARWAVAKGLAPLRDLSRRVQDLGPDTLGTRFEASNLPTELRPIAEQLGALLVRLEEAFEREKRFSSAASHELRTPIAELRMLLEVAMSQRRTEKEWSHTASAALGVLARAQSLCEALLRLSRANNEGSMPNAAVRSDVGSILLAQADRALTLHGSDSRCVRVEPATNLRVHIDPETLASIVGNLLDNAMRHGEASPDAPVMVNTTVDRGRIHIDVSNPAPALTQEDVARLFEPFWRKDDSRTNREGFGLGLSVARSLARAYGGDLTADLRTPNALTLRLTLCAAV